MNKQRLYSLIILLTLGLSLSSIANASDLAYNKITATKNHHQTTSNLIMIDSTLINWIRNNTSAKTQLPLSFQILKNQKLNTFKNMGAADSVNAIIERVIVEEGLIVYDGAVAQIALSMTGREDDLKAAQHPLNIYWDGSVGQLSNIRAGYPINQFIYDPKNPEAVSSNLNEKGKRGFIFRIINANGKYSTVDPLDGKSKHKDFPSYPTIHWEDWKPVAGENAWVTIAALQLFHKKYFDPITNTYTHDENTVEIKLAKELARAAMLLQTETGGIRMAPLGTYRDPKDFKDPSEKQGSWWYNQISSENNISWYAAMKMLYQVTGDPIYQTSMAKIERFFQNVWNEKTGYFAQGLTCYKNEWIPNDEHFALDVQTWGLLAFGCEKIDTWLGEGASFNLWENSKSLSSIKNAQQQLLGVGYTTEHDRLSVEWTAGAIMAAEQISTHYQHSNFNYALRSLKDAHAMRKGVESLRHNQSDDSSAYSYSSRRGWIPFGWNSHDPEVLSLASTGWMIFVDAQFNPFVLPADTKKEVMLTEGQERYAEKQRPQSEL